MNLEYINSSRKWTMIYQNLSRSLFPALQEQADTGCAQRSYNRPAHNGYPDPLNKLVQNHLLEGDNQSFQHFSFCLTETHHVLFRIYLSLSIQSCN